MAALLSVALLVVALPARGQATQTGMLPGPQVQTQTQTTALPAQALPAAPRGYVFTPAAPVSLSPQTLQLLTLEGQLQQAVEAGGGKAFASWFTEDGVILADGQPPVSGAARIAETATWDPRLYHLSWTAQGAQMDAAGDMGFTWGRYVAQTINPKEPAAPPAATAGRYITVWKKTAAGWKIALESSGQEQAPVPISPVGGAAASAGQPAVPGPTR